MREDIISSSYVASPAVYVHCQDPALRRRVEQAVTAAGGVVCATPGAASFAIAAGDYDLAGAVARLRDERIAAVVHPAAVDAALEPTLARLIGSGPLELASYLPGAEIAEIELDDHAGRQRALAAVDRLAVEHKVRRSVRDRIATTCDELMMNALYDAPIDGDGALVFGDVEPAERLAMSSPRPVTVRYGAAGDQMALSVADRFGRLERSTLLDTLDKCLSSADPIDRKKLGSGLGLFMVCNAASGLVIEVVPGESTRIIALFAARPTALELLAITG